MSRIPQFHQNLLDAQVSYGHNIRDEALPTLNSIGIFINVTRNLLDTAKERDAFYKSNPNAARPILPEDQRPLPRQKTIEILAKCQKALGNFPSSEHITALKDDVSELLKKLQPPPKPATENDPLRNDFLSKSRTPQPMARRAEDGSEQEHPVVEDESRNRKKDFVRHMSTSTTRTSFDDAVHSTSVEDGSEPKDPAVEDEPRNRKKDFARRMSVSAPRTSFDDAVHSASLEEIRRIQEIERLRRFQSRNHDDGHDRFPSRSR